MDETGSTKQSSSAEPGPPEAQSRVCDTCRIRKCKCSNERPTCASCRENGWQCTYSLKRKRPGPVPGSRRKKQPGTSRSPAAAAADAHQSEGTAVGTPILPSVGMGQMPFNMDVPMAGDLSMDLPRLDRSASHSMSVSGPHGSVASNELSDDSPINNEGSMIWFQQNFRELMNLYFEYIQPCYPFMHRHSFDNKEQLAQYPRFLLLSMGALAVRFMPRSEFRFNNCRPQFDMAAILARQAAQELEKRIEMDFPIEATEVKATVLLTVFEYTRRPGRRALEQTGKLARIAYSFGLHTVDSVPSRDEELPDIELQQKELKRILWWTIWRLDSYACIATCTPFNINDSDIATCLPGRPEGYSDICSPGIVDVPETWKRLLADGGPFSEQTLQNMFIIMNSFGRDAALMLRLQLTGKSFAEDAERIHHNWNKVQELTPAWFWDPKIQNTLETPITHRLRLEVLLQSKLFLLNAVLPPIALQNRMDGDDLDDPDTDAMWQAVVTAAEGIVLNIRHWTRSYYPKAEPFTCFLAWIAAVVLKLEYCRLGEEASTARAMLQNYIEVADVALNEFSSAWELASLLSESLQHFKLVSAVNVSADILLKLAAGCFGPLNPKQTHFTSDLKPGPDFYSKMNAGASSDQLCNFNLNSNMLSLSDDVLNFTFQSPFLDGLVDDLQFSFS